MKMTMSLSSRIGNVVFFCTMLILLMHISYAGIEPSFMKVWLHDLTCLAVPAFFAISGYLLAQHCEEPGWYKNALRKRFYSLVVPYFALNTLCIPMLVAYHNVLNLGEWQSGGVAFDWYSISRIYGLSVRFHPSIGQLWYIRCLLMFIVLSPLLVWVIRRSCSASIFLVGGISGFVVWVESQPMSADLVHALYSFFSLRGFVFFSLGIAWACWGGELESWTRFCVGMALCACVVYLQYFVPESCGLAHSLPVWVLAIAALWLLAPARCLPCWVTSSCFALFVLHLFFYQAHALIVGKLDLASKVSADVLGLEVLLLTIVSIFLIAFLVRRYAPRVGAIFFGGRC